jgi:3-deoxy-D-arabino-heptulosonate 7-phosphate (DAHP) synthase
MGCGRQRQIEGIGPEAGHTRVQELHAMRSAVRLPEGTESQLHRELASVMIDCSHGNSEKDYRRQAVVAASISEQVAGGSWQVFGAMVESHLVAGRQDYVPGRPAVYGQSITDARLSLEQTEPLLEQLARAQQARGVRAGDLQSTS